MFPTGAFENWTTCESLLPHAQKVIQYGDAKGICTARYLNLLSNEAHFDWLQGRYEMACFRISAAVDVRKKILGSDGVKGRWEEAEKLHVKVLEARRGIVKAEHSNTLDSIKNLAIVYKKQGQWKKAEKLHLQVSKASKRVPGEEDPDILGSMENLATTYYERSRWKEAEELLMQALEARKRVQGPEHPGTLNCMAGLALAYKGQHRCKEAIALMQNVVDLRTRIIGANHPLTARSVFYLEDWLDT
ncbi:hypothetical protein HO133_005716 [Letharia lupina]|uniref:Kinesin light chain n=1 Tax=Letharia lupina TaxID=560253 RepID=A0A8H6C7N8_9LECA|nr:uncharacterized protein HO133_005716 [Letharia lupina]KAF6218369.1 hypothetical protein HO133_005716 [Letharia lupina]